VVYDFTSLIFKNLQKSYCKKLKKKELISYTSDLKKTIF
jgi:hypothetical protein